MKYRAPETIDTGGGNWLDKPGTYHLIITAATESPLKKNGEMLDGFRITCQAIDGTVRDSAGFTEKDKTVELMFWHPKLTDKNEGMFSRQKQAKLFIATGLLTEEQLGQEVDLDLEDVVGKQIIATLEANEGDTGRTFLDLHFSDLWHVDDPAAAKCPKNQKAIELMPPSHRRKAESFAKRNGQDLTHKPKAKLETVDLDDL